MDRRFAAWGLIGAVALTASLFGHALQLGLESAHLFGDLRAAYAHAAQGPMGLAAAMLAAAAFIAMVRRVFADSCRRTNPDRLLPALRFIDSLGAWRCIAALLAIQFSAFTAGELIEQSASGYQQIGFGAFLGAGHVTAVIVQLAVGAIAGLLLQLFAREAYRNSQAIARCARTLSAWLSLPAAPRTAALLRAAILRAPVRRPPRLSLRTANRPPPALQISLA